MRYGIGVSSKKILKNDIFDLDDEIRHLSLAALTSLARDKRYKAMS